MYGTYSTETVFLNVSRLPVMTTDFDILLHLTKTYRKSCADHACASPADILLLPM